MYNGNLFAHPLSFKCTKFVTRHKPLTHKQWLDRLSSVSDIDLTIDCFNTGPTIEKLEVVVAEMLGKERALFVHKGMVGQNAALKQWSVLQGESVIAVHPQSHIICDESDAYQALFNLEAHVFGQPNAAITASDIAQLPEKLAAIVLELPVRRAGFQLPSLELLDQVRSFASNQKIPLHIDGARLLEAAAYYQLSPAELAQYGDSVYISLYKSLGAMAGGIIAGESEFIDDLVTWRSRQGGDLFTAFPYVLSAFWGIEHYLPRINEFNERASGLAQKLKNEFGDASIPLPVQCNGFLVELPISAERLEERVLNLAQNEGIWICDRIFPQATTSRIEIQVGDALDDWTDNALIEVLKQLCNS